MLNPSHCPHVVHASLASPAHPRKPNVRPSAAHLSPKMSNPQSQSPFLPLSKPPTTRPLPMAIHQCLPLPIIEKISTK